MRKNERELSMNHRKPRQVLECASLSAFAARQSAAPAPRRLALWRWRRANQKRQKTGAAQDATAQSIGSRSQCMRKSGRGLPHSKTLSRGRGLLYSAFVILSSFLIRHSDFSSAIDE